VVVGGGITELAPLHKGNSGDAFDYWDRMIFLRPLGKEQLTAADATGRRSRGRDVGCTPSWLRVWKL